MPSTNHPAMSTQYSKPQEIVSNTIYVQDFPVSLPPCEKNGPRRVCEAEWHDQPFVRAIASTESGLPLVALGNANQVVSVAEVDLRVKSSLTRHI